VEEHSCHGGLGEACAAVLMEAGVKIPFRIVALPDEQTVTGGQLEIFQHYGIAGPALARTAKAILEARPLSSSRRSVDNLDMHEDTVGLHGT